VGGILIVSVAHLNVLFLGVGGAIEGVLACEADAAGSWLFGGVHNECCTARHMGMREIGGTAVLEFISSKPQFSILCAVLDFISPMLQFFLLYSSIPSRWFLFFRHG
jgi:hypothetical protein